MHGLIKGPRRVDLGQQFFLPRNQRQKFPQKDLTYIKADTRKQVIIRV